LRPALVILDAVDAQADDLHVALLELGLEARHRTQLRRADRGEVLGVREQDGPLVPHPVVKAELAFGGLGGECGGLGAEPNAHGCYLLGVSIRKGVPEVRGGSGGSWHKWPFPARNRVSPLHGEPRQFRRGKRGVSGSHRSNSHPRRPSLPLVALALLVASTGFLVQASPAKAL